MKHRWLNTITACVTLAAFVVSAVAPACAQGVAALPVPGAMVNLSATFQPPVLNGIKVYADEPFRFDFILDEGDVHGGSEADVREVSDRLIRYFLAALTVPEKELWVNLSPYEKDRIISDEFGQTGMGRDLLMQDYLLKQITSSALYPEGETGKKFWARIYAKAQETYGTTDIPIDTFNKVWIVPAEAVVVERSQKESVPGMTVSALVAKSRLKVMLESDYVAVSHQKDTAESSAPAGDVDMSHQKDTAESSGSSAQVLAREVIREVVVPELEKEINEGQNFSLLRQVYQAIILAAWYKRKIKESLLSSVYVDQKKLDGININDPQMPHMIWARYVESFRQGAYNYIKEEKDLYSGELIPRKYFSGGCDFAMGGVLHVTQNIASLSEMVRAKVLQVRLWVEEKFEKVSLINASTSSSAKEFKLEMKGQNQLREHSKTLDAAMLQVPWPKFNIPRFDVLQKPIVLDLLPELAAGWRAIPGLLRKITQLNAKSRLSLIKRLALAQGNLSVLQDRDEVWLPIESAQDRILLSGKYRIVVKDDSKHWQLLELQAHFQRQVIDGVKLNTGEILDLQASVIRDAQHNITGAVLSGVHSGTLTRYEIEDNEGSFVFYNSERGDDVVKFGIDDKGKIFLKEALFHKAYSYDDRINKLFEDRFGRDVLVTFQIQQDGGVAVLEIKNNSGKTLGMLPVAGHVVSPHIQKVDDMLVVHYKGFAMRKEKASVTIDSDNPLLAMEMGTGRVFYYEALGSSGWQEKDPMSLTNMQEARDNGWVTLDVVPRPLSLETISQRDGLHATDLLLVHRTNSLPENGIIRTTMNAVGQKFGRDTIHFSLNHPVSSHEMGNWDDKAYTILLPLVKVQKERIEQLNLVDTWIRGNVELPEGSFILGVQALPEGVNLGRVKFVQISDMDQDIEKVIRRMNYEFMQGGKWSWSGSFDWTDEQNKFADKEGLRNFRSHMNHWSEKLERIFSHPMHYITAQQDAAVDDFVEDVQKNMPLFAKVALVQKLGDEIITLKGTDAWSSYYQEYVPEALQHVLGTAEHALEIHWNNYAHWERFNGAKWGHENADTSQSMPQVEVAQIVGSMLYSWFMGTLTVDKIQGMKQVVGFQNIISAIERGMLKQQELIDAKGKTGKLLAKELLKEALSGKVDRLDEYLNNEENYYLFKDGAIPVIAVSPSLMQFTTGQAVAVQNKVGVSFVLFNADRISEVNYVANNLPHELMHVFNHFMIIGGVFGIDNQYGNGWESAFRVDKDEYLAALAEGRVPTGGGARAQRYLSNDEDVASRQALAGEIYNLAQDIQESLEGLSAENRILQYHALIGPTILSQTYEQVIQVFRQFLLKQEFSKSIMDVDKTGGIDLKPTDNVLSVDTAGRAVVFYVDPALLQEYGSAPGFTPVIMGVEPLSDVKVFLGIADARR